MSKEIGMFEQFTAFFLAALLINLTSFGVAQAATNTERNIRFTEKIRANILKLGIGQAARVKVALRDKTKLEGYISAADEKSFTVTDLKSGAATEVSYSQVKSAKGNNLSTRAKIAIGVGIAAAVIFVIYFVTVVYDD
jgi:hypothetical protein